MACEWHSPSKALKSNVHTEVEVVLSSKKWALWYKQDTAIWMPNVHSRHGQFGTRSVQTARKLRDNSEMCQIFGKKAEMPNFPPPRFIASLSTGFIWQVPFHGSQTHRPPRLLGKGPRWPLRGGITAALTEQLQYLSCFQALEWEGRPVLLFAGG